MGELSKLLDKGGLASMLNTIFLILTAMTFGGMLDQRNRDNCLMSSCVASNAPVIVLAMGAASSQRNADRFLAITLRPICASLLTAG